MRVPHVCGFLDICEYPDCNETFRQGYGYKSHLRTHELVCCAICRQQMTVSKWHHHGPRHCQPRQEPKTRKSKFWFK